jgi:hypothetical protein
MSNRLISLFIVSPFAIAANTDLTGNGEFLGFVPPVPPATPFAFAESNTVHPNGVIGGGQVGYNYQFSPTGVSR